MLLNPIQVFGMENSFEEKTLSLSVAGGWTGERDGEGANISGNNQFA